MITLWPAALFDNRRGVACPCTPVLVLLRARAERQVLDLVKKYELLAGVPVCGNLPITHDGSAGACVARYVHV